MEKALNPWLSLLFAWQRQDLTGLWRTITHFQIVQFHRPAPRHKASADGRAAALTDFRSADRERRIISAMGVESEQASGILLLEQSILFCGSILRKRPVRETQTTLLASLDSHTFSSNAKKAAKNAGLSRLFSPMSRI